MSSATFKLFAYLAILGVASAASCSNPLGEAWMIDLESSQASRTGTCADDVLGGKSCCSQEFHDDAEDSLLELYEKYASSANYYVAMVEVIDDVLDAIYDEAYSFWDDYGISVSDDLYSREDNDDDPELSIITSGEWRELVASWPVLMQTCHQKIFDLGSAFQCLACDPNWDDYMDDYGFYLTLDLKEENCADLSSACEDGDETFYFFELKFAIGFYMIQAIEILRGNQDYYYDQNDLSIWVDYTDDDYDAVDDWEEGDLTYFTYFSNCDDDNLKWDSSFIYIQVGIFGPSVYALMLMPNNYYNFIEEFLLWADGDDSSVFSSRRLLARDESAKKNRQLWRDSYFVVNFGDNSNYPDAFEIAATLDTSPVVEELYSATMAFSLIALVMLYLTNLF